MTFRVKGQAPIIPSPLLGVKGQGGGRQGYEQSFRNQVLAAWFEFNQSLRAAQAHAAKRPAH